ncbi:hypothetical protein HBI25_127530 [Parastagonospora nodorum]|uniref:SET domain-containing protein n=1 Tax=Phaeosphaeria nodorum (strain SN15 / ATCC MYA-4574 / FGSC 10173) TaxID=321614 RepID=A0A7U2FD62_PHANO|nr:hypothetical protein HBH54_010280 [Parastagonospora nodorum]QRD03089.1 hypothetical protein JI435_441540 [Parastagonospora nodorum SN15]KAH4062399.1 hypothetical protein HBH50_208430 [Parastagonospora nodorum]KAH4080710.1 hypothetical protein HBH48_207020 [Parastagonospora nodorum]KAH4144217.1 hypothetical protein HBH45_030580 [Parastagonospora nodorum]
MRRSMKALPSGLETKFQKLMGHSDDDPVNGRIRANGFGVKINGYEHLAEETLSHYVHAVRTIYPGEEITISYIFNDHKQARLSEELGDWNFNTINQTHDLDWETVDWMDDDSKATPEIAETLTSLHQQENLQTDIGRAYKHAAKVYGGYGKKYEAMKYARLAVEMLYLSKGFSHLDFKKKKKEMANNRDGMNHEASSFSS